MTQHSLAPIKSTMASHAGYDPKTQALTVKFKNGSTFRYDGVPHNIGETVMGAASFGGAFNKHVAGIKRSTKLE
jgi:hypothetical protein